MTANPTQAQRIYHVVEVLAKYGVRLEPCLVQEGMSSFTEFEA